MPGPTKAWDNSFAYGAGRDPKPYKSVHVGTGGENAKSDAWLQKSMSNLEKTGGSAYRNNMSEKDREKLLSRMAAAGREYNRGHITEAAYGRYVTQLLKGNKRQQLKDIHNSRRPSSSPSLGRRAPVAEGRMERPQLAESLPRRTIRGLDTSYEQKVRARSARQRTRALAWMEKVAKDDQDVDDELDDALPLREGAEDRSEREVTVSKAPRSTTSAALKEALEGQFGRVNRVDPNGRGQFLVRFKSASDARRCAKAGRCLLKTRVLAIIPRDGDLQGVKKICSKFGRVLSCLEVIDNGNRGAVVTFETAGAASRAVGEHPITAPNELDISGIPAGSTAEHVSSALGGKRDVVRVALDPDDRSKAIAVIVNPTIASRLVGKKLEIGTVSRGGSASALERAQFQASNGRNRGPWGSCLVSKPYADNANHSYGWDRGPTKWDEFKKRAAGTYDSKAGQKLPGKARAYTTTKHYLSAALRKTTLEIGSHDVELIVSSN